MNALQDCRRRRVPFRRTQRKAVVRWRAAWACPAAGPAGPCARRIAQGWAPSAPPPPWSPAIRVPAPARAASAPRKPLHTRVRAPVDALRLSCVGMRLRRQRSRQRAAAAAPKSRRRAAAEASETCTLGRAVIVPASQLRHRDARGIGGGGALTPYLQGRLATTAGQPESDPTRL